MKPTDLFQYRTQRAQAEVDKRFAEMLSAREVLHPGKLDAFIRATSQAARDRIIEEDRLTFLDFHYRRAWRVS